MHVIRASSFVLLLIGGRAAPTTNASAAIRWRAKHADVMVTKKSDRAATTHLRIMFAAAFAPKLSAVLWNGLL